MNNKKIPVLKQVQHGAQGLLLVAAGALCSLNPALPGFIPMIFGLSELSKTVPGSYLIKQVRKISPIDSVLEFTIKSINALEKMTNPEREKKPELGFKNLAAMALFLGSLIIAAGVFFPGMMGGFGLLTASFLSNMPGFVSGILSFMAAVSPPVSFLLFTEQGKRLLARDRSRENSWLNFGIRHLDHEAVGLLERTNPYPEKNETPEHVVDDISSLDEEEGFHHKHMSSSMDMVHALDRDHQIAVRSFRNVAETQISGSSRMLTEAGQAAKLEL